MKTRANRNRKQRRGIRQSKPATRRSAPAQRQATVAAAASVAVLAKPTHASPPYILRPDPVPSRMAPKFPEDDYDYTYLHDFLSQPFVPGACRAVVFACGKGEEAVLLSERGYRVTGLDADRNSVGLARERAWLNNRDVDFMIGEIFESANLLPAESFGLASDRGIFRAIGKELKGDERDRRRFLDHVRRLLLPGGVFLLNATEVDPARKGRAPKPRARVRGQNDLLVQAGGEVMGEVLRAGLEIVGRRLYTAPVGPDGEGAGKQVLLLYCRK